MESLEGSETQNSQSEDGPLYLSPITDETAQQPLPMRASWSENSTQVVSEKTAHHLTLQAEGKRSAFPVKSQTEDNSQPGGNWSTVTRGPQPTADVAVRL